MAKKKVPFILKLIRFQVKLYIFLNQRWANNLAVKLFLTPPKVPTRQKDLDFLKTADRGQLEIDNKKVATYSWGRSGKKVLFVHGWGSQAGMVRQFGPALLNRGYRLYAFDAIGHGQSEGKKSAMPLITACAMGLAKKEGPFDAIIGHSLGGAAALFCLHEGHPIVPIVTIAPAVTIESILSQFFKVIHGNDAMKPRFDEEAQKLYGKPFVDFTIEGFRSEIGTPPLLIAHDKGDQQNPYSESLKLKEYYPGAKLISTENLGHNRIMSDQKVLKEIVEFLEKELAK